MTDIVVTQQNTQVVIFQEDGSEVSVFPQLAPSIALLAPGPQGVPGPGFPRSITIAQPVANDSFTLFRAFQDTVLGRVRALVVGTAPGVTYELRYAADRTAAGTLAIVPTEAVVTTSGSLATIQNMPIPSGHYLWLNISAVSGVVNEFNLSIDF